MRRVVLPSEEIQRRSEYPAAQPSSLLLIPLSQEGSLVQRAKTVPERIELDRMLVLVIETKNEAAISEFEAAPLSTPMPYLAIATTSQEIPATPVTAQTLLLLTFTLKFDRTATPAISEPQLSSASHSQHTVKLPSGVPLNAEAFPNDAEVQMDLILANQHIIMANQTKLQAH